MSVGVEFDKIYQLQYISKESNRDTKLIIEHSDLLMICFNFSGRIGTFVNNLLGRELTCEEMAKLIRTVLEFRQRKNKYYDYLVANDVLDEFVALMNNDTKIRINEKKLLTKIESVFNEGVHLKLMDLISDETIPHWRSLLEKLPLDQLPKRMIRNVHPEVTLLIDIDNNREYENGDVNRFNKICKTLPIELQEKLCNYAFGINREYFPVHKRTLAFMKTLTITYSE